MNRLFPLFLTPLFVVSCFAQPVPLLDLATAKRGDVQAEAKDGAIRLDFAAAANPSISFKPATPWNWKDAPGLAFSLANSGDLGAIVTLRLQNGEGKDAGQCSAIAFVPAKTKKEFTLDFSRHFSLPRGVSGRIPEPGPTLSARPEKFDLSAVSALSVSVDAWNAATLELSDVHTLPAGTAIDAPPALEKIVDKYGQFAWADWPGKVQSDADLAAQKAREDADLAKNPAVAGRDRFGGWADGPTLAATGFFRVDKHEGKWTFIDPEGRLFLSFGVTCVSPIVNTSITGRESLFSWLPDPKEPLSFARTVRDEKKEEQMDFRCANLERKFGPDWETPWRATAQKRLPSWGFNTIGAWSNSGFYGNSLVPYVVMAHIKGKYEWVGSMPDPWDADFAAAAREVLTPLAEKVKTDPFCLGYFVDNEMPWSYDNDIAFAALKKDAAKSPGKAAFIEQLKAKYTTIEALNAAWDTQIASWEALAAPFDAPKGAKTKADLSAFCKAHALKYFTVVRDTIHATDPNHLYLGCRFAHASGEAYQAATEICDVVSYNVYQRAINGGEWGWLSDKKPILVGEFHFGALDRGMFRVGLQGAGSQKGRGAAFENYVRSVVKDPRFIGCHWFQYSDQPLTGRPGDGENYNIGFVSVADAPYPEMVEAARDVLGSAYEERWGKVR